MMKLLLLCLVILATGGCTKENKSEKASIPDHLIERGKLISNLIDDPSIFTAVDLDKAREKIINPNLMIGKVASKKFTPSSQLVAESPTGCIQLNNGIYITDEYHNAILLANKNGKIIKKIGEPGSAPGQFSRPFSPLINKDIVAIYDFGNDRVQIFDLGFNFIGSIEAGLSNAKTAFPPTTPVLTLSDEYLFVRSCDGDSALVRVYETRKPFKQLRTFLSLSDEAKLALCKELILTSSLRSAKVCVGFQTLPYLFIFDESGRQLKTIQLQSKMIENSPKLPKGVNIVTSGDKQLMQGKEPPIQIYRHIIKSLLMLEDETILLATDSDIYTLEKNNQGTYTASQKLRVQFPENKINLGLYEWYLHVAESNLYITIPGINLIVRVDLL